MQLLKDAQTLIQIHESLLALQWEMQGSTTILSMRI